MSMVTFHVLYWDNTPEEFVNAHKAVMEHFCIPVKYYKENTWTGDWMDRVITECKDDIIGFMDIDCIPISREKLEEWVEYVQYTNTFIGPAQTTNRPEAFWHTYAAAACLIISKACYDRIGRPSFDEKRPWDMSEGITVAAEQHGIRYRAVYPKCFESPSAQGAWYLHNYGFYGWGTIYDDAIYHLFQSRYQHNQERFIQHCYEVINGTFDYSNFIDSQIKIFRGPIWYMNSSVPERIKEN